MARQLLLNTGFETGAFAPWVPAGTTTVVPASTEPAHTGFFSARLEANNTTAASISQAVLTPLALGSLLRLSFFLRRDCDSNTSTIIADVTLFAGLIPLPGFVTVIIPPDSNPGTSKDEFEYYESFSTFPVPAGVTSALLTILVGVTSSDKNKVIIDDVFLVEDVL